MENDIEFLIKKITDKEEKEAFKYVEQLAAIGTDQVFQTVVGLLENEDWQISYLAAKVLGKMEQKEKALDALMGVIHNRDHITRSGELAEALEAFDLSNHFVDVLRIYLFGNYKASVLAKGYLDHTEFEISPRTIKKAKKHWRHYQNNVKRDHAYDLKEEEVNAIFQDLDNLFQ